MKKSLIALIALCLAAMLALSSCTIPGLNIDTDDLLAKIGLGKDPVDPQPAEDPSQNQDPEPVVEPEEPIEIPDPEGRKDSNTYVLQFPLYVYEEEGTIRAVQVEMNKTLTMRVYAVPENPVDGKQPVMTFSRANKTGVGYGKKDDVCATLGDNVFCFEYTAVPVSVLGKDKVVVPEGKTEKEAAAMRKKDPSNIVISLANTNEQAVAGNYCAIIEYFSFIDYFEAISANDEVVAEAYRLLKEYAKALNDYTSALSDVKVYGKEIVSRYADAFEEYGRNYWKYQRGEITEEPVAPELPPLPDSIPVEKVDEDIPAATVEGFTLPEGAKEFELTPSTKKIENLKNYIAGVYLDFTGTAPVLVFRVALDNTSDIDVRLNDYRITENNLKKAKETASSSVVAETILNAGIADQITNADELDETVYYLIKTDTLTIETISKVYTLTIYDEENNMIESLSYSAADYIRAFAAGRDISEDVLEALKYTQEEVLGAYEYEKDKDGNYILDEDGRRIIIYQTDAEGNYVLDKSGNKIPVPLDLIIYEVDEKGDFVLDKDGKKVPVYKIKYQKDANGELILDGDGNPIPEYNKYLQTEKYQVNGNGEYILDGDGNKILAYSKYKKDAAGAFLLDEYGAKVPDDGATVLMTNAIDEYGAKIPDLENGAVVLNEKDSSGNKIPETMPYVVETEIVTYHYPVAAEEALGNLLIAWYNLSLNEYLTK